MQAPCCRYLALENSSASGLNHASRVSCSHEGGDSFKNTTDSVVRDSAVTQTHGRKNTLADGELLVTLLVTSLLHRHTASTAARTFTLTSEIGTKCNEHRRHGRH